MVQSFSSFLFERVYIPCHRTMLLPHYQGPGPGFIKSHGCFETNVRHWRQQQGPGQHAPTHSDDHVLAT